MERGLLHAAFAGLSGAWAEVLADYKKGRARHYPWEGDTADDQMMTWINVLGDKIELGTARPTQQIAMPSFESWEGPYRPTTQGPWDVPGGVGSAPPAGTEPKWREIWRRGIPVTNVKAYDDADPCSHLMMSPEDRANKA